MCSLLIILEVYSPINFWTSLWLINTFRYPTTYSGNKINNNKNIHVIDLIFILVFVGPLFTRITLEISIFAPIYSWFCWLVGRNAEFWVMGIQCTTPKIVLIAITLPQSVEIRGNCEKYTNGTCRNYSNENNINNTNDNNTKT